MLTGLGCIIRFNTPPAASTLELCYKKAVAASQHPTDSYHFGFNELIFPSKLRIEVRVQGSSCTNKACAGGEFFLRLQRYCTGTTLQTKKSSKLLQHAQSSSYPAFSVRHKMMTGSESTTSTHRIKRSNNNSTVAPKHASKANEPEPQHDTVSLDIYNILVERTGEKTAFSTAFTHETATMCTHTQHTSCRQSRRKNADRREKTRSPHARVKKKQSAAKKYAPPPSQITPGATRHPTLPCSELKTRSQKQASPP